MDWQLFWTYRGGQGGETHLGDSRSQHCDVLFLIMKQDHIELKFNSQPTPELSKKYRKHPFSHKHRNSNLSSKDDCFSTSSFKEGGAIRLPNTEQTKIFPLSTQKALNCREASSELIHLLFVCLFVPGNDLGPRTCQAVLCCWSASPASRKHIHLFIHSFRKH